MQPSKKLIESIAAARSRTGAMQSAGMHPATFYRWARKYHINLKTDRSSYILTAEDDALIMRLVDAGFSLRSIGEKFEVCHTTIAKRVNRHNRGVAPSGAEIT